MEIPVSSNLQKVPLLSNIVKKLLALQTAISTNHQLEKSQEKFLHVMRPLSRLW